MKTQTKNKLVKFFITACHGIRQEYENGASYRSLRVDVDTLKTICDKDGGYNVGKKQRK